MPFLQKDYLAMMMRMLRLVCLVTAVSALTSPQQSSSSSSSLLQTASSQRRSFLIGGAAVATAAFVVQPAPPAQAVGPVKVQLLNPVYTALPCPPSKPIPGEKAMKGLRGLCVTVKADLAESPPKDLEKVGVYGFITDGDSGDSVLANNPDLSTDAGQFAMIESVKSTDNSVTFEFVAAIPKERDISQYDNGIGPLDFKSLKLISFPGGQQYGEISPCEMNEFSAECEDWEAENGPYTKGKFMVNSNERTKGR